MKLANSSLAVVEKSVAAGRGKIRSLRLEMKESLAKLRAEFKAKISKERLALKPARQERRKLRASARRTAKKGARKVVAKVVSKAPAAKAVVAKGKAGFGVRKVS